MTPSGTIPWNWWVLDGVSFSKVISLQFSDCNFAIKRIHFRFFLENVPKTSCLKKIKKVFFWDKGL